MNAAVAPAPGRRVLVRVPATSANLGPGFDTLGLALSVYDELDVTALPEGELEIEVTGVDAGTAIVSGPVQVLRDLKDGAAIKTQAP